MLEHVAAQHHLERRERRELATARGVLDVADDERFAMRARTLGGERIGLDVR